MIAIYTLQGYKSPTLLQNISVNNGTRYVWLHLNSSTLCSVEPLLHVPYCLSSSAQLYRDSHFLLEKVLVFD